jgi:hypothetical protein
VIEAPASGVIIWLLWSGCGGSHRAERRTQQLIATGRSIRVNVFDIARVVDGRIVEHWGVPDRLAVLLQLGLLAPPAPITA